MAYQEAIILAKILYQYDAGMSSAMYLKTSTVKFFLIEIRNHEVFFTSQVITLEKV